jgi:hypothetical protein
VDDTGVAAVDLAERGAVAALCGVHENGSVGLGI